MHFHIVEKYFKHQVVIIFSFKSLNVISLTLINSGRWKSLCKCHQNGAGLGVEVLNPLDDRLLGVVEVVPIKFIEKLQ